MRKVCFFFRYHPVKSSQHVRMARQPDNRARELLTSSHLISASSTLGVGSETSRRVFELEIVSAPACLV